MELPIVFIVLCCVACSIFTASYLSLVGRADSETYTVPWVLVLAFCAISFPFTCAIAFLHRLVPLFISAAVCFCLYSLLAARVHRERTRINLSTSDRRNTLLFLRRSWTGIWFALLPMGGLAIAVRSWKLSWTQEDAGALLFISLLVTLPLAGRVVGRVYRDGRELERNQDRDGTAMLNLGILSGALVASVAGATVYVLGRALDVDSGLAETRLDVRPVEILIACASLLVALTASTLQKRSQDRLSVTRNGSRRHGDGAYRTGTVAGFSVLAAELVLTFLVVKVLARHIHDLPPKAWIAYICVVSAVAAAAYIETVLYSPLKLQLFSPDLLGWAVIVGVGVLVGTTVFWMLGVGLWTSNMHGVGLKSAGLVLAITMSILVVPAAAARVLGASFESDAHLTIQPPAHSVFQDTVLYAGLVVVTIWLPSVVIARLGLTSDLLSDAVKLIGGLAAPSVGILWFHKLTIENNVIHRNDSANRIPQQALEARFAGDAEIMNLQRLRQLAIHHRAQSWLSRLLFFISGVGILALSDEVGDMPSLNNSAP